MKINEIPTGLLNVGIRIQHFKYQDKLGTLVEIGEEDDPTCSFQWDTEREPTYTCQASVCDLEVVKLFEIKTKDKPPIPIINCWWEGEDFVIHDFDNRLFTYHKAWFSSREEESVTVVEDEGVKIVENFQFNYVERPHS